MSIEFYKEFGPLGYLASYSNHGFYKDNIYYKTVEHYYQANKFSDINIKNRIINAKTPKEASTIGRDRTLKRIDNFKKIKLQVMYDGVLEKFRQNTDIRNKLIETRNKEIKEMTVKENFWGVGPNLDGENHFGKILMKVRTDLKNELLSKIINNSKNKKVYIIGHHNPDFDSIVSSYLLTKILREEGIDAHFSVRDNNYYDKELMDDYLNERPRVISNYNNKLFVLVDHNHLEGIPKENVVGCIDHHIITNEIEDIIEIEYASCTL